MISIPSSKKGIWESSTHFNPVDLVCGLRNYRGESFDLPQYVDPDMGFISQKSKDGRELKALELPGLWKRGYGGLEYTVRRGSTYYF